MAVQVVRVKHRTPQRTEPLPQRTAPAAHPGLGRSEIAERLAAIRDQARSLRPPQNRNPEAWHEDKSELVRAIERLEDDLRRPASLPNSPEKSAGQR